MEQLKKKQKEALRHANATTALIKSKMQRHPYMVMMADETEKTKKHVEISLGRKVPNRPILLGVLAEGSVVALDYSARIARKPSSMMRASH